ncbi:class I SAM-dependent methyltransferase [Seohaeicola nanhaiensis]|uniref:Class I SAM-dependent methyltransferase n=1 Tax=Seohaeicola nanhaiensis TaxID=1387282 RepID=A0ABV9KN11_9RHOB
MTDLSKAALAVYAGNADRLIEAYEAVNADQIFAPFLDLLPGAGATALDIGTGTGRDAAWLAARGLAVTAVEPTEGLRAAGITRHGATLEWMDDILPNLPGLGARTFDLVVVNAVWHHLGDAERDRAARRLAALLRSDGLILLSLRHGPEHPGQPVVALEATAEVDRLAAAGLRLVRQETPDPHQGQNRAAGVTWIWLALRRDENDQ